MSRSFLLYDPLNLFKYPIDLITPLIPPEPGEITLDIVNNTSDVYSPTILYVIEPEYVTSTATVLAPAVLGDTEIAIEHIANSSFVGTPAVFDDTSIFVSTIVNDVQYGVVSVSEQMARLTEYITIENTAVAITETFSRLGDIVSTYYIDSRCNGTVNVSVPKWTNDTGTYIRAQRNVSIEYQEPALINGIPENPELWAKITPVISGHAENPEEDPGPVPTPDGITYSIYPASRLPSIGSLVSSWPSDSIGNPILSSGVYRPEVVETIYPYGKGLLLRGDLFKHLWLDLGQHYTKISVIVDCIVVGYPSTGYLHIFDSGMPTPTISELNYNNTYDIPSDNINERVSLRATKYSLVGSIDPSSNYPSYSTFHNETCNIPRMYFMTVSMDSVKIGYIDPFKSNVDWGGGNASVSNRYLLFGRSKGKLGPGNVTNIIALEYRVFYDYLGLNDINEQYRHLSTKYKHSLGL